MNSTISPNHILTQVRNFAKDFYDEADDLHGWGHITRVLKISENLAKFYPVDSQTLEMGVLLHDIGRKEEKIKKMHHAELSVELSTPFLQSIGLEERIISDVSHIIRSHSFSLKVTPEIIEAKILSDADKLDALGAVGIYRECAYQKLTLRRNNRAGESVFGSGQIARLRPGCKCPDCRCWPRLLPAICWPHREYCQVYCNFQNQ